MSTPVCDAARRLLQVIELSRNVTGNDKAFAADIELVANALLAAETPHSATAQWERDRDARLAEMGIPAPKSQCGTYKVPVGWTCFRERGHEGQCFARQIRQGGKSYFGLAGQAQAVAAAEIWDSMQKNEGKPDCTHVDHRELCSLKDLPSQQEYPEWFSGLSAFKNPPGSPIDPQKDST